MGIILHPEVKMARRILAKHSIKVPFDLNKLVEQYAKIIYKKIPVEGVDGICMNLKTPKKVPKIIVNSDSSEPRKKFTLAHELGHIIIPWHYGTIIDDIQEGNALHSSKYWDLEREANRFASEILMPFDWVFSLYKNNRDTRHLIYEICLHCGVSQLAAEIRLENAINEIIHILVAENEVLELYRKFNDVSIVHLQLVEKSELPPTVVAKIMANYLPGIITYCIEQDNKFIVSGGTPSSYPFYQLEGSEFVLPSYRFVENYTVSTIEGVNTHWHVLDQNFTIVDDERTWQEILDKIVNDIDPENRQKLKASINGKISGANGSWKKKKPDLGVEEFIRDTFFRFNNPQFSVIVEHPDFLLFLKKRGEAFFQKN